MVKQELIYAAETGTPITIIILDLDNFKQVNDEFGHNVGDKALSMTGSTIKATIRDRDSAGRYGGDEFLIILPETTPRTGRNIAERIRVAVTKQKIVTRKKEFRLGASIGVAGIYKIKRLQPSLFNKLFIAADKALYKAKRKGKNQVCTTSIEK